MEFELIREDGKWLVRCWESEDSYIDHPLAAACPEDAVRESRRFVGYVKKWNASPVGPNYTRPHHRHRNTARMYI